MKVILEFTLPEERYAFEHADRGASYYQVLADLRDAIRRERKHSPDPPGSWDEVLELFWDTVNGSGVELE